MQIPEMRLLRAVAIFCTLTLVMVFVPVRVLAEPTIPTRLDDLLSEALKNNPEILAAQNNVKAAEALAPQAWGLDNPELRLENDNALNNPFDSAQADQNRIGFSQAIPFPAKLFGRAAVAAKELAAAQAQYNQTIQAVSRDVKKAYADLFLAMNTEELLEESRQALDAFRDIATRKYSLGKASQADVLGVEVEIGKLQNEIVSVQAEILTAQATLKSSLNKSEATDFEKPDGLEPKPMRIPVEDLVKRAQDISPVLLSAKAEQEKAQAKLSLAWWEYVPDVMVQTEFRQVDGGPDMWDGFLGVSIPLWVWKQQGMIDEARSRRDQSRATLSAERNKTILAVREAYARVQSTAQIAKNLRSLVIPQAEQTLKVSQTAYQNDKIDFLTLITYWRTLLNYRIDWARVAAQYEIALADLEQALGSAIREST